MTIKVHKNIKILVIDDDSVSRRVMKLLLEDYGYKVDVACSGSDALKLYKNSYDIIFLDINLFDSDGVEIFKKIRADKFYGARVSIVAATADAFSESRCIEAGFDGFILKPVISDSLADITKKLIEKKYNSKVMVDIDPPDMINYHAINLLESIGNDQPSQKQIDLVEDGLKKLICLEAVKQKTIVIKNNNNTELDLFNHSFHRRCL